MEDLEPGDKEIIDLLRSFRSRGSRLVLDIPTLLELQCAIDRVTEIDKGHGYVTLDIKQCRFHSLDWGVRKLLPQEKLRKSS